MRARQKAVEDLQSDRNLPVHLLSELVQQLPDGVYITTLKQTDQTVAMQGMAQSNERVSEMLRNLSNNTPWLSKPELVEIVASTVSLSSRDQRRVAAFNLRFQLMRSSEAQKAMEAASAAGEISNGKNKLPRSIWRNCKSNCSASSGTWIPRILLSGHLCRAICCASFWLWRGCSTVVCQTHGL